ncbi:hypothetical protein EZJ19_08025 [Parasulfuritortus cantonensis]|uniref:Uncharacterized protein n=1 Tax=Parasulfuritortus cantonensis TaxID=2528202 RepID=A0A4R1BDE5_9PROT|nr:hypothetical protein [Parasulfuritortus cantonensis]TCJ15101.1 hypothetical protein EZJ19_08025 [Parasulfuritortus cantonensis]
MSNPYRLQPDFRLTAPGRLRAWTGALLVHAGAAAALLLAWPQAADYLEQAIPVEVRMLAEAAKPPEPPPPPRPNGHRRRRARARRSPRWRSRNRWSSPPRRQPRRP